MANKRIRSRRPRAKDDLLAGMDAPAPKKQRRLARQSDDVNREIHRLECLIADAPRLQKQRQLRRRNTLPPPDEFRFFSDRGPAAAATLPLHARRLQQKRRILLLAQLALVLLATAAIAGWTRQWLQW